MPDEVWRHWVEEQNGLTANQVIETVLGAVHWPENSGTDMLHVRGIQMGSYGNDDKSNV